MEIASITVPMSDATPTRGDAPVLLDSVPRKRIQEIRKDADETLVLFPAFVMKLTVGGIPVVPPPATAFKNLRQ
eukprot:7080264-Pyramimonas_sp.AAC.1